MTKIYSFYFIFSALFSFTAFSQQNVSLKINHQLGAAAFAMNQAATNDLGNSFTLTRLEYYISEIKLIHDGGTITDVPNTYILVDAASPTNVGLGSFNITSLEGISFGIGVEAPINNADPSLQATSHPLAPKSPSMHWGWASGYRFVALEGNTGTNMSQIFQIHALGNRNYNTQSIVTGGTLQNGIVVVELTADYTQALSAITVNSNLLYHGEFNEGATLLSNFQTGVFSQSIVGLNENDQLASFVVYPNPSSGKLNLSLDASQLSTNYVLLDVVGREILKGNFNSMNEQLSINEKGIYFLNLYKEGSLIAREKVIVQ